MTTTPYNFSSKWIWVIPFMMLAIIAVVIQTHIHISWDISWLMDASWRFMHGGTYAHNFVENNPPLILYLYSVPVWLSHVTGLDRVWILRAYIWLYSLISLSLCALVLHKTNHDNRNFTMLFILTLAVVYWILPGSDFGQREYISLLFCMPFGLLIYARTQQLRISPSLITCIAILAAIAFGIKPYFLGVWCLLELYLMWQQRNFLTWMRWDNLLIALLLGAYLTSIFILTPTYIHIILPLVLGLYVNAVTVFTSSLLLNLGVFSYVFAIIMTLCLRRYYQAPQLLSVLMFMSLGYFIAYLFAERTWYYHIWPFYMLAIILLTQLTYHITLSEKRNQLPRYHRWASYLAALGLLFLALPPALQITLANNRCVASPTCITGNMVQYARQHAQQHGISFISISVGPGPTVAEYANVAYASRFPSLWPLPGIIKLAQQPLNQQQQLFLQHAKNWLLRAETADLQQLTPDVVFVNQQPIQINHRSVNLLEFFKQDAQFRQVWQQYHYQFNMGPFAVYQRS